MYLSREVIPYLVPILGKTLKVPQGLLQEDPFEYLQTYSASCSKCSKESVGRQPKDRSSYHLHDTGQFKARIRRSKRSV